MIYTWGKLKMGKSKKEKRKSEGDLDDTTDANDNKEVWQQKIQFLSPISQPLAPRKLSKKLYKAVKKGKLQQTIQNRPKN